MASAGVTATFVTAIDGRQLVGADAALAGVVQPHLGRPLSLSEIGCLLSHLAVLDRVVDEQLPLACVMEDDAVLADDVPQVLAAIESGAGGWDVLLLGHHSARHPPGHGAETGFARTPLTSRRATSRVAEFAMGAYGYVVTLRGAEQLLAYARPLRMPMDWVTGYSPVGGVRLHAVTPPCVLPEGSPGESTIGGRDGAAAARPATVLRTLAGRAWLVARKAGLWPDSYVRRY